MDEAPIAPIKEEKIPTYNKKAIRLIVVLITGGVVLGLTLSSIFITEANDLIQQYANEITELFGNNIPPFIINSLFHTMFILAYFKYTHAKIS